MNGKMILSLLAIIEIGIFAIPAGIMAGAFEEQYKENKKKEQKQLAECRTELRHIREGICPHCKRPIGEDAELPNK